MDDDATGQGAVGTSELRARAEARLRGQPERAHPGAGDPAVRRVLHELEVHQIELEMQNEELQRSQVALEVARAKYFDLYDLAPVGYLTLSATHEILEANLTAATMLGVDRRALRGQVLPRFLLPEDAERYYFCYKQLFEMQAPQRCELRLLPRYGAPVWVRLDANASPGGDGAVQQWRIILSDITDAKRAEEGLQRARNELDQRVRERTEELALANAALKEDNQRRLRAEEGLRQAVADKDALLREVHHRTKNNLQMLCDLLYLQMAATPEGEKQDVLQHTYGRIYAIARLHEQLYQSLQAGQIPLQTYLHRLVEGVQGVYQHPAVRIDVAATDVALDLDRAVHVGLIVNELVANALKHGFPGGSPGEVVVHLTQVGDQLELSVRDSGRGLPGDLDVAQARTLGLRIVHILARRLHASVEVTRTGGTAFTLRFPVQTDAPIEPRQE